MHKHSDAIHRTQRHTTRTPDLALQRKALPLCLSMALAASAVLAAPAHAGMAGGMAVPGANTGTVSVSALTSPTGGTVMGGVGSISQNGSTTVINQVSNKLALDWLTFNVGKDATVQFNQPSFTAVALNRILDQNPSQIFGRINSNGQVFLINTHGIIFGSTAQVNVGGLMASTLDLTPTDFLANHFNLDAHGGVAGVVNHGTIAAASGGSVSLIGGSVANDGLILASYGNINLDGADKAVLDFDGNGLINIQVTGELKQRLDANAAVSNSGTLQADGGTVVLQASAAKDLFTDVVNNSGVITAGGISTDGGTVRLVASGGNTISSGRIDATGTHGGSVQLLSDAHVGVTGGSVDASGTQGGGSIRVGGGWQGGEGLQTATATYVAKNATLHADATQRGQGGSVVVWGDQVNNFYGSITARGGVLGGDGGRVETSSHDGLNAQGAVDASASRGAAGMWLLDPRNVDIVAGGTGTLSSGVFSAPSNNSTIDPSVIDAALTGGTSVTVFTGPGGSQTGDITVTDPIAAAGAGTLYLKAAGSILLNAAISSDGTNALNVNLWANYGGTATATSYTSLAACATCTVSLGAGIATTGGNVDIRTGDGSHAGGAATFGTGGNVDAGGGNLSVTSKGITQVASGSLKASVATLNTGGASAVLSGTNQLGTANLTGTGAAGFTLNNGSNAITLGTVSLGSGDLTVTAGGGIALGGSIATGGTQNYNNQVNLTADTTLTGSTVSFLDGVSGSHALTVDGNGAFLGTSTIGSLHVTGTSTLDASMTTSGGQAYDGAVTLGGNAYLGGTTVTLADGVQGSGYALTIDGDASLAGSSNLGSIDVTGATSLAGDVTTSGAQSYEGALTLAGDTTLDSGDTVDIGGAVDNDASATPRSLAITSANGTTIAGDVGTLQGALGGLTIDADTVSLAGLDIGGDLALTTHGGDIAQSAGWIVGGTGTFDAGAHAIVLDHAGNDFAGTVTLASTGQDATVDNGTHALTLGSVQLGGGLDVAAGGGIALSDDVTTAGGQAYHDAVTLLGDVTLASTGGGAIGFDGTVDGTYALAVNTSGATSFGGAVGATDALASLVTNAGGSTTLTGNVTTGGSQTYGDVLVLAADTTVTSTGNGAIAFDGTVDGVHALAVDTGGSASFGDRIGGAITLSSLTLDATGGTTLAADVTTSGSQQYNDALTLGGDVTLTSTGGGAIGLGPVDGAHDLVVTAGTVSLGGAVGGGTALSSLALTGSSGIDLGGDVTTFGGQSYNGAVTLVGDSLLRSTGNGAIDFAATVDGAHGLTVDTGGLASFAGAVGGIVGLTGLDATGGTLDLGSTLNIDGDLALAATAGAITQNGAFTVTGTSSFDAGSQAITLTDTGNDFGGAVSLSGGTTQITDQNALTLGTLATGALTATSTGALNLGHGSVGGNLLATSNGGAIGEGSGGVQVSGTSNLQAGTGAIGLTDAGNHFSGAVTAAGQGVSLKDSGNLTIAALSSGTNGTVNLTAGGSLTLPTSGIDTGTADLTLAANGGSLVMPGALSGANVTLVGRDGITLGSDLSSSGTVTLTSSQGAITQTGGVLTAGTLTGSSLTSTTLDQANLVDTLGDFTAAGFSLTNAQGLTVSGTVDGGSSTSIVTSGNLGLGGDVSGTTTTLDAGGTIDQTGGIVTATTLNLGSVGGSSLTANNQIANLGAVTNTGSGGLSLVNATDLNLAGALDVGTASGNDVNLQVTGNLTQAGGSVITADQLGGSSTGDTTLGGANLLNTLGGFSAANLSLSNAQALTVNGPLSVPGTLSLSTTAGSLTLATDLTAGTVVLDSASALTLANDITAAGLSLTADGAISQTGGALAVSGLTTVDANGNAITLTSIGNDFGGAVSLSGGTTQITDQNALTLGTLATGALTATSTGALNLGHGSVGGNLLATSNGGAIGEGSGGVQVSGTSNLQAGTGAIGLTDAGNHFSGAVTAAGQGVSLKDSGNLTIAALSSGTNGTVNLTAGGSLTLPTSGIDTGTADLTLAANGGSLVMPGALSGANVTLVGRDGITLGSDLSSSGTVTLTSSQGAITQTGGVLTAGTLTGSSLTSTTLDQANLVDTLGDFTAAGFSLTNAQGLTVSGTVDGGSSTSIVTSGNLGLGGDVSGTTTTLDAGGTIDQTGGIVTATTLNLGSVGGSSLTANNQIANLGAVTNTGSGGLSLVNATDLNLAGALDVGTASGNDVNLQVTGNLTQAGGSVITADQLGGSSTGDTTLGGGNQLNHLGSFSAANLSLSNAQALAVDGPLSVPGTLSLTTTAGALGIATDITATTVDLDSAAALILANNIDASTLSLVSGGTITQTGGALTVSGTTTVNAGSNAITLSDIGNDFVGAVSLTGGTTQIADANALTLGTLSTGALTVTSHGALDLGHGSVGGALLATSNNGAITEGTGGVQVTGTSNLQAGSGAITLIDSANHFAGAVTAAGQGVRLKDAGDLTIASLSSGTNGTVSLTAGGALILPASGINTGTADLTLAANGGSLVMPGALSGANITLSGRDGITLDNNLSSAGTVTLTSSNGAIGQSGGVITAGTLNGSSHGNTTLNRANRVGHLGNFTAANFSLVNAQALAVTGTVSTVSGSGAISLTTTSGALDVQQALSGGAIALHSAGSLALSTNVTGSTVALTSNGNISQSGGVIQAGTLTGSAAGSATLTRANKIGTLGNFSAANGLTLSNAQALTVGGTVDGGSSTTLTTTAGKLTAGGTIKGDAIALAGQGGLAINGTVNAGAGDIALASAGGAITEGSAGALIGGGLSGSAAGAMNLGGANQIVTLGNVTTGGDFSFRDTRTLTVNSPLTINGGNGNLSLTTTGSASDLILATDLTGRTVALAAGRDITQAGSAIRATTLTGSAGRDAHLTGANHIGALGDFTAGSLTLDNAQALNVTGSVSTGSGALALATSSGKLTLTGHVSGGATTLDAAGDMALNGALAASTLALHSGGAISEGSGGAISAGSLTGSATGAATLNGANHVGTLGSFNADGFQFTNAGALTVTGPIDGGRSTRLATSSGDLALNGRVSGTSTTLVSAGAITEGGSGKVVASTLSGQSAGSTTLDGANSIDSLGSFRAAGLSLSNGKALAVVGPVDGGASAVLTTSAGDLSIEGALAATKVRLVSAGAITEGSGGVITAGTLSGQAVGATSLGSRAAPIANHVGTLGNFSSPAGFSLTNAQTLTLASVEGSSFTIDAGHAALYLGVTGGDLLQSGETPLYDGAGTFFSSGKMGTAKDPIYVIGDSGQVIADVGEPPAYFYALDRQGNILPLTGDLSFNVPTSLFFGKAQNGNGRGDAYIDPSVISANYRSFGIVPSGILLPEDQQQCQPELEDCSDE